jgi:hypothetical protein
MAQAIGKLITGAAFPAGVTDYGVVLQCKAEYFGTHAKKHNATGFVNGTDAATEQGVRVTITVAVDNYANVVKANDSLSINLGDGDGGQTFIVESNSAESDNLGEEVDTAEIVAVAYYAAAGGPPPP